LKVLNPVVLKLWNPSHLEAFKTPCFEAFKSFVSVAKKEKKKKKKKN
jgi:hypothetical protein